VTVIAYQRETDDWRGFTVTNQTTGQLATGWSYQIVARGARPTGSWLSAVVNGTQKGIDIQGLSAGYYSVFFRIEGQAPYAPVLDPVELVIK